VFLFKTSQRFVPRLPFVLSERPICAKVGALVEPNIIRTRFFVESAVGFILHKATEALTQRGRFILGLCGGKTPEPVYAALAQRSQAVDWSKIIITFSDERCVGPSDAQSNFHMASESLLSQIPIPPENVLRMQGELLPSAAAQAYEKRLLELGDAPEHDLLLLGVGNDGHTASLFPGTVALGESERWVVANPVPQLNASRITLTYRTINASRCVCFLVNDPAKDAVIGSILEGDRQYPASFVSATEAVCWIIGSTRTESSSLLTAC